MIALIPENDERLKQKTESVTDFKYVFSVVPSMTDLMLEKKAIGLAAPQVGIMQSFFIFIKNGEPTLVINPEILERSAFTMLLDEGCLSFPDLWLKVKRPETIRVNYYNIDNNLIEDTLHGVEAQCFEHEWEHLQGITFDTKIPKLSLTMAKDRRRKLVKRKPR